MTDVEKDFSSILTPQEELSKIRTALVGGETSLLHNVISEVVTLDDKWIKEIETGLYSIEKIVKNPKKFIKDEEFVVDVEKAKKTSARTVRHLASHTRNIANIEKGEIRPKRVLTVEIQEELGIYENRFIVALIERLLLFVEKRYKEINDKMQIHNITNISMNSEYKYGNSEIAYKLEMTVKEPPIETEDYKKNADLIQRIEILRRRIRILTATEFYKSLSSLKPIRPPIAKTNILVMNTDYHTCYKLWLYVSAYTFVGYSVETQDKQLPIDADYYDDMTLVAGLSFKTLLDNDKLRKEIYQDIKAKNPKKKKYKVLTKYKFEPKFTQDSTKLSDDLINEYYFNELKSILTEAVDMPEPTSEGLVNQKVLDVSFSKFVRSLGRINFEMYDSIIRSQSKAITHESDRSLSGRRKEINEQEKTYKKYLLLSKLKSNELEKALRAESREYIKLEKMKSDFEVEEQKRIVKANAPKLLKENIKSEPTKAKEIVKRKVDEATKKAKAVAKEKQKATQKKTNQELKEKVAVEKKKAKQTKDKLFQKDQERLIAIAERNRQRKEELMKKIDNK